MVTDAGTLIGDALQAAARTHPGRVRLNNEDLPLIDAARGIFGVIDGIGGQAGGEVAAATARDVILQRLARPLGTRAERVREAIAIANNEIHRRAQESSELVGMACVITLALVSDGRLTVGHVGDSRLYKMRPDGLRKLTHDHSPVGEREDAGELTEVEAMRHPRRHEVFRDVGSLHRDKDEQEFVDVIEEPLERDSAILLCSDGLTDMLPAATIAHIVRQHAGSAERVVEALVTAANDAGGRDNVTVVYAEMPLFAAALGRGAAEELTPTEPPPPVANDAGDARAAGTRSRDGGVVPRVLRAIVRSRSTWFATGMLAGVVGALMLTLHVAGTLVRAPQTLTVAADGSAPFPSLAAAIDAARPGDTIRVEPGVYAESVQLRDGVDLLARVPGTVTITRPDGLDPAVPSLAITGALNVRVSGVRIDAPAERQAAVGVRVSCPAATLELIEITGAIQQAISVSPSASVALHGSRIASAGTLVAVPDDGHATFVNSILVRTGEGGEPPISAAPSAHVVLRGNVFNGYGTEIVKGFTPARRQELLSGNIIVPREPDRTRPAERRR